MQDSNLEISRHLFASRLNAHSQTDWAIEIQAKKTWTQQPVPIMSEHSAHLTSLPFGFRTSLWRYTCLLLSISMLWHRQADFDALAQGIACNPTIEPINYRGRGSNSRPLKLRQPRQLPVVQHVRFMPLKSRQKHNSNDMPEAALDNWQPVWNAQVSISTHVYVLNLNCALALAIYIFVGLILMLWFRESHINPQRNR